MDSMIMAAYLSENLKTIFAYAANRIADKSEAEDLTSEIVLALLESAPRLRNPDALYGFIWSVAGNTYKKHLQRRKRREIPLPEDETAAQQAGFEDGLCRQEDIRRLKRELSLLSTQYRRCTVDYYFHDMSCRAIAEKEGLSLEMVKYYLFKSKNILKEGLDMERQLGERSYNPAQFQLHVIFEKQAVQQYTELFNRKICGNILLSAYYTSISLTELSLELGIPTAYLEDELQILEKYGLVICSSRGKYQTNIIIFTKEFLDEVVMKTGGCLKEGAADVSALLKGALHDMRSVDFYGSEFDDNRLLWLGLLLCLFYGKQPAYPYRDLFPGCRGCVMGYEDEPLYSRYYSSCAGFSQITPESYCSFVDLHLLGEQSYRRQQAAGIAEAIQNRTAAFPILTDVSRGELMKVLDKACGRVASLYREMADVAAGILRNYAPESISAKAEEWVLPELGFALLGMLPEAMVKDGWLLVPGNMPVGMFAQVDRQGVEDFYRHLGGGGVKYV